MWLLQFMALTGVLWGSLLHSEQAESATQGSVSYVHGDGYISGDTTRNTTRFDVRKVSSLGVIYGRADAISSDDRNSSILTRVIGHYHLGWHGAVQLQNQDKVSQTGTGFGYSDFRKCSSWFVDMYRMSSNYYGDGYQLFGYGNYKFSESIKFDGFIELTKPESGQFDSVLFAQPSLMYQVHEGVWLGVEQQRYFNKAGIRGLDEVVNQVKVKWEF